jgi:hypothetical protein
MKNEFIRLVKFGTLTAILEIVGAIGLLVGLLYNYFIIDIVRWSCFIDVF